jgi:HD-GYP domain-containing protein (c-di-GMP phosphodiesterase class II)
MPIEKALAIIAADVPNKLDSDCFDVLVAAASRAHPVSA